MEQLELALAEMEEEDAAQAETAAQMAAAAAKIEVRSFERRKPARRPLPEHLPRERIVYPAPAVCPCCGGALHKIGEDVTETLEPHPTPALWKARPAATSGFAGKIHRFPVHRSGNLPVRVRTGKAQTEQMFSDLLPKAVLRSAHL